MACTKQKSCVSSEPICDRTAGQPNGLSIESNRVVRTFVGGLQENQKGTSHFECSHKNDTPMYREVSRGATLPLLKHTAAAKDSTGSAECRSAEKSATVSLC